MKGVALVGGYICPFTARVSLSLMIPSEDGPVVRQSKIRNKVTIFLNIVAPPVDEYNEAIDFDVL